MRLAKAKKISQAKTVDHKVSLTHQLVLSDSSLGLSTPQKEALQTVLKAYGLAAKNIKNSTLFIIKNLQSSYQFVRAEMDEKTKEVKVPAHYKIKDYLHAHQQQMMDLANQAIVELNQEQIEKFKKLKQAKKDKKVVVKKVAKSTVKNKSKNKTKISQPRILPSFTPTIEPKTFYNTFNKTLVERIIKLKEVASSKYKDYTQVHSYLAQGTLQKTCDDFDNHIKSLVAFHKNPDSFSGRPKSPIYMKKNDCASFEISSKRFKSGTAFLQIIPGRGHQLFTDFKKKKPVSVDVINTYNSIDLESLIWQSIKQSRQSQKLFQLHHQDLSLASVRIIPNKYKDEVTIEYVIHINKKLSGYFPDLFAKSADMFNKEFFELKPKQTYDVIKEYFNKDFLETQNKACGNAVPAMTMIDCGLVNFCAVSYFTTKDKQAIEDNVQDVISGKDLKHELNKLAEKSSKIKSESTTPEYQAICAKRATKQEISKEELAIEKKFHQDLYSNPELLKCYQRRNNITMDYIHKLSKAIVAKTHEKGIKVIIVGKNTDWKQHVNMGADNNQWMHDFPHAKFIELLKYKAIMKDILVVEQEESYTSKTSFIHNIELQTKEKTKKIKSTVDVQVTSDTNQTTEGLSTPATKDTSQVLINSPLPKNHQFGGVRSQQQYITEVKLPDTSVRQFKVHADVHGSLNIGRKLISSFNFPYFGRNMNIFKFKLQKVSKHGNSLLVDLNFK
jgi:IS605 OrfB family transposase